MQAVCLELLSASPKGVYEPAGSLSGCQPEWHERRGPVPTATGAHPPDLWEDLQPAGQEGRWKRSGASHTREESNFIVHFSADVGSRGTYIMPENVT